MKSIWVIVESVSIFKNYCKMAGFSFDILKIYLYSCSCQVRPVVETGYENLLLVRLLLETRTPSIRKSSVGKMPMVLIFSLITTSDTRFIVYDDDAYSLNLLLVLKYVDWCHCCCARLQRGLQLRVYWRIGPS
jgi:hypothetical protein